MMQTNLQQSAFSWNDMCQTAYFNKHNESISYGSELGVHVQDATKPDFKKTREV
jgi:hypothetical protein